MISPEMFCSGESGNDKHDAKAASDLIECIMTANYGAAVPATHPDWLKALHNPKCGIRIVVALWFAATGDETALIPLAAAHANENNPECALKLLCAILTIQQRANARTSSSAFIDYRNELFKCLRSESAVSAATAARALSIGSPQMRKDIVKIILSKLFSKMNVSVNDKLAYLEALAETCDDYHDIAPALQDNEVLVRCYAAMWMLRLGGNDSAVSVLEEEWRRCIAEGNQELRIRLRTILLDSGIW